MPSLSAQASSVVWIRNRRSAGVPSIQWTTSGVLAGASTTFSGVPGSTSRTRPAGTKVTSRRFSISRTGTVGSPARTSSRRGEGGGGTSSGGGAGSGTSGGGARATTGGGGGGGTGRDDAQAQSASPRSHRAMPVPLSRLTKEREEAPPGFEPGNE